jgi:hypothetical protein
MRGTRPRSAQQPTLPEPMIPQVERRHAGAPSLTPKRPPPRLGVRAGSLVTRGSAAENDSAVGSVACARRPSAGARQRPWHGICSGGTPVSGRVRGGGERAHDLRGHRWRTRRDGAGALARPGRHRGDRAGEARGLPAGLPRRYRASSTLQLLDELGLAQRFAQLPYSRDAGQSPTGSRICRSRNPPCPSTPGDSGCPAPPRTGPQRRPAGRAAATGRCARRNWQRSAPAGSGRPSSSRPPAAPAPRSGGAIVEGRRMGPPAPVLFSTCA